MVSINLNLPEDVKAKIERRAAEHGHPSVEDYIETLVREDIAYLPADGPERTAFGSQEEFEAKLLEGLQGTGRVLTDADCEAIVERFEKRHGRK